VTVTSQRIALAVDNVDWQKFRVSLKGLSTAEKLHRLKDYFDNESGSVGVAYVNSLQSTASFEQLLEDIRIRVDNYLKALARGGLIEVSTDYMYDFVNGDIKVRR